jgi:ATP-dependent protease HslVU (ClpYQ) peptidase subunit
LGGSVNSSKGETMTCIVAVRKENTIILGGDSAASGNNRIVSRKDKKVFKRRGIAFGFAGSFRIGQLIKYSLKIPKRPNHMYNEEYVFNCLIGEIVKLLKVNKLVKKNQMDCNILIGYGNQIYKVDADFQIEIADDEYAAIGDGGDIALGALYALKDSAFTPEEKAQKALEASARYCTTVSAPFYYVES